MLKQTLFLCFVLLLIGSSCRKKSLVPEKPVQPFSMALVIGNPIDYGVKDLLIFPIGANYNPKIQEKEMTETGSSSSNPDADVVRLDNASRAGSFKLNESAFWDSRAKQEYVNQDEDDFDIRNVLFYNKRTGSSYILSKDTLHVLSFAIHNEFNHPLVFYRVVKKDINRDGKYNSTDAVMLYVSGLDGTNFIQVTPQDEQFFDYFYYPETQSILIKTAFDIDQDSKFTELDETTFREMRLHQPAAGKEIFAKSLKDSLKNQLSMLR